MRRLARFAHQLNWAPHVESSWDVGHDFEQIQDFSVRSVLEFLEQLFTVFGHKINGQGVLSSVSWNAHTISGHMFHPHSSCSNQTTVVVGCTEESAVDIADTEVAGGRR
jgi:hypothetical protein